MGPQTRSKQRDSCSRFGAPSKTCTNDSTLPKWAPCHKRSFVPKFGSSEQSTNQTKQGIEIKHRTQSAKQGIWSAMERGLTYLPRNRERKSRVKTWIDNGPPFPVTTISRLFAPRNVASSPLRFKSVSKPRQNRDALASLCIPKAFLRRDRIARCNGSSTPSGW